MSSVLASQLQALARQRQPALPSVARKGKPSLLFDFQKAADVDLQTIYDVACQGLEELTRLEPRFRPYRESLFSRASLDLNPDLQTIEFLAKLNESIYNFCCLLCNHFLSPSSFKVLEYLIRRYKANERNVDALMTAALPYHSTNEFVRLVQTLALGGPGSLWGWLSKMQTSGAALPRDLLAQRCVNDRQLLLFICKAAGQLGGAPLGATGSGASSLRAHSRTFLSFYAVLLCEVLAVLTAVGEDVLAALLPFLLDGLGKGAALDYRAATLMIIAELLSRATLGKDFIKVLLNTMLKHTEPVPEHIRTTLLVMAHTAVTQEHIRCLSYKTLKYLTALPNAVSELATLVQRGNIRSGPLLLLVVRGLSASLVSHGGAEGSGTGRRCEGDLLDITHSGALRGEPARILAASLLEAGASAKADVAVRESCQRLLRVLDLHYPESTDVCVNAFLEPLRAQCHQRREAADCNGEVPAVVDALGGKSKHKRRKMHHKTGDKAAAIADDENDDGDDTAVAVSAEVAAAGLSPEERARFEFVRATFASGGYSTPCGGTMMTLAAALMAPQAAVRRMALQQLDTVLSATATVPSSGMEAGATAIVLSEARAALTAATLTRLRDDDLSVVVAALGLSCLTDLPPAALLDALVPLANQLGDFFYGGAKLPQLKAARKAVRKVISLLQHVGSASVELRQSASLHLLALMLPSQRDPRVAVEAARGASKLGVPLFAELGPAADALEAQLAKDAETTSASGVKAKSAAAKAVAVAVAVERGIVSAIAKTLAADAASISSVVKQLIALGKTAAIEGGEAAEAAARRAQHLLLLASHAAAVSSAPKPGSNVEASAASATHELSQLVLDLAEMLLPNARLVGGKAADTGDVNDNWRVSFSEQVSPVDGLPTDKHVVALASDAIASHAALVLGALQGSLALLPEASADTADAQPATAKRTLSLLASLDSSPATLLDLPLLVVTRSVKAADQSAFLASIYAAPSASMAPGLQCLALHVQTQLATAESACSWLVSLLPALASADAGLRSVACDCLAAVSALLAAAQSSLRSCAMPKNLPAPSASLLCSALMAQRKLICQDPDAVTALLHGALLPPPVTAGDGAAVLGKKSAVLSLPASVAADVVSYLRSCLHCLGADAAGVNTACTVLACVAPRPDAVSAPAPPLGADLFSAGCAYLGRLVARIRGSPEAATPLDSRAVEMLVLSLFTPASVAAAVAAREESALSYLAETVELLPLPAAASGSSTPATVALAAGRLAAVRQVSPELFAVLPVNGRTVLELFAVLLGRYEGDPDEEVRAAARSALESVPLSAELLVPLLDPPAVHAATAPAPAAYPPAGRSKKSKKSEPAAAGANGGSASSVPLPPLNATSLRDAVAVLELLQWRTDISSPHLLVSACQSLLRRMLPIADSIASVLKAEADGTGAAAADVDADVEAVADADTSSAKSSLAGYASTLALQALTALTREVGTDGALGAPPLFDFELAVRTAREAPDAAVRNAALGLLAALSARIPEAALKHVLQVLAVVNQSAAVQDDEHSRAVGATALAAVVPAWVAAGRRPAALWDQVVTSLPSLPAHRRLDVLLALMRALPVVEEGLADGLLVLLQHTLEPQPKPVAALSPAGGKTPKSPSTAKSKQTPASASVQAAADDAAAKAAEPPPSEWLPELASQLALQVDLPLRLACCARVLEVALSASGQQPHKALPRTVVVFITAQLKLKVAVNAASATFRRPEPDPALDQSCRRLMQAALAQMQLLQPDALVANQGSAASPPQPSPSSGANRAILAASRGLYGLFAALQGVMAADAYLQSLLTLAEHPADKVKRRAIKLFTDKVRGVRSEIQDQIELPQRVRNAKLRQAADAAARACNMLPPLLAAAAEGRDGGNGASPLTRQLALVSLSAIASEFGAQQQAALLAAVPAVLSATRDSHASIRASALATVAAFVRALQSHLVPVLPATVAAAIAAADSAWTRLARAGTADAKTDVDMGDAGTEDDGDEDSDSEDDDSAPCLRRRSDGNSDVDDAALELSSALACLNALVETVGGFLSPHLPSVLALLLNPRVLACTTAGCNKFAASIRARLPAVLPPRLLLPALYDRLEPGLAAAADVAAQGEAFVAAAAAAPTVALLQMVSAAASAMEAKMAAQFCDGMFGFLLRALDVRQRRPAVLAAAGGDAAIDAVEGATIAALVTLVIKLSEARFKPLFLRLLEWASTVSVSEQPGAAGEPSYLGRMVALFGAVSALADRLRSVLVPYYRYLLDLCIQHLGGEEGGLRGSGTRSKKKARRIEAAATAAAVDGGASANGDDTAAAYRDQQQRLSWLLRLRIVRALHRCFLHDSVGFLDADRFARLQPALVAQLAAEPPDVAVSLLVSRPHLIDPNLSASVKLGTSTRAYTSPDGAQSLGPLGAATIGGLLAMAVAANNDALWKPLNHATLMLTRSASARVRALALEAVAQLVERLREEYLVLLPEALPFLSELLEDGDAGVAARVREVVAQLEEISGEKLDEYLKV